MRLAELSAQVAVPVATIKYYLREGLLMPGRSLNRTRAEYGDEHVQRLRLIRSLIDVGGLGIAQVRTILAALDDPPESRHDLLGIAAATLPPVVGPGASESAESTPPEVSQAMDRLGWLADGAGNGDGERDRTRDIEPADLIPLSRAVRAAQQAGVPLPADRLVAYATAQLAVAQTDLDTVAAAADPAEALHIVVVGTLLTDPVLLELRRLAQVVASGQRWG